MRTGTSRRTLQICGLASLLVALLAAAGNLLGIGDWTAVGAPLTVSTVAFMHVFTTTGEVVRADQRRRPSTEQFLVVVVLALATAVSAIAGALQQHDVLIWVFAYAMLVAVGWALLRTVRTSAPQRH